MMERTADDKARAVIANMQQLMIFAEARLDASKGTDSASTPIWYTQVETLKVAINIVRSEFGFPI